MKNIFLSIAFFLSFIVNAQQWQLAKIVPHAHQNLKSGIDNIGNVFMIADTVIYKLDANGVIINQYWLPPKLRVIDLKINLKNELVFAGTFTGNITFGAVQFTSTNYLDVFVGVFTSNLEFLWGKSYGGPKDDWVNALAIDSYDNIYICGFFTDTVNVEGNIIKCHASGNSFLAKFGNSGTFSWIYKDSTSGQNSGWGLDLYINKNNELLLSGKFSYYNYFHFNNLSLTIPPLNPEGYNYGYDYYMKFDNNGNGIWAKCYKKDKWNTYYYKGLSSENSFRMIYGGGGGFGCSVTLLNSLGENVKDFDMSYTFFNYLSYTSANFLGMIDEGAWYISYIRNEYKYNAKRKPNIISSILKGQLIKVDTLYGNSVANCQLFKNSKDEYYLTGLFSDTLLVGFDTLIAAVPTPFVTKFNTSLIQSVELYNSPELINVQVYPNPTKRGFTIKIKNEKYIKQLKVDIRNVVGQIVESRTYSPISYEVTETIDLGQQVKGVYFIEIVCDGVRKVRKIIIE